jgi:hypothetical protein
MKDHDAVFENFHRGLVQVHGELREGASGIEAAVAQDDELTRRRVAGFCLALLNHHKAEDVFLFPAFRAAGRLKTSDVGFLAARDREHVEIHRLCLELRDVGKRLRREEGAGAAWRASVTRLISDLAAASSPHFAEEEAVLTPAHVATMISGRDLVAVYRDMGENWNRR